MLEMDSPDGWDEQEIAPPDDDAESGLDGSGGGGPRRRAWWVGIAVALLAVAGTAYYFYSSGPDPEVAPSVEPTSAALAPSDLVDELTPSVSLPALAESDPFVRDLIGELLAHPRLAGWLAERELVRRFVASVDNVARGESPVSHLSFLRPKKKFAAVTKGDRSVVATESYARFDSMTEVVDNVSIQDALQIYRTIGPLLDAAHAELGSEKAGQSGFEPTLVRAIQEILDVPILEESIELTARFKSFHYADASLEQLSDAQKLFLRLGPANLKKVQIKLRGFRAGMGSL